jgi:hypothetical protein
MERKISVACECEGQVLLQEQITAVIVSSTSSMDSTTQLSNAPSVDELLAHVGKQTGISSEFFNR